MKLTDRSARRKQHKFLAMRSWRSFAAKILLELHESALLHRTVRKHVEGFACPCRLGAAGWAAAVLAMTMMRVGGEDTKAAEPAGQDVVETRCGLKMVSIA
ncbi:MAG: hypothetical protein ABSG04_11630, partial [Verrucomicrobiota bacterium]